MVKEKTIRDHYIAGLKTQADWLEIRAHLNADEYSSEWDEIYSQYYFQRLELRYLNPIEILREHDTYQGEGFSIVTILCSLVEFLESTCQGKVYRYVSNQNQLNVNEYMRSKKMFTDFLVKRAPFNCVFSRRLADEFYSDIRCGLLHEASTKNGWRIRAGIYNRKILDHQEKILFRDEFEDGIRTFIDYYSTLLKRDSNIRRNFIVKWDSL